MSTYNEIVEANSDGEHSADPIDVAADRSQREIDHRVRETRARIAEQEKAAEEAFTGQCLNCGDAVEAPRRWCCKECVSDWENANKARNRRGY